MRALRPRRALAVAPGEGSTFTVRELGASDGPLLALATLGNANWSGPRFTAEQIDRMPDLQHYYAPWPRESEFGAVADDAAATPIGVAWARRFAEDDPGYGFVSESTPEVSVWVASESRGHGIGTHLMGLLIGQARARGVAGLSLSVEAGNPARRLYERLGFTPVGGGADPGTLVLRF